MYKFDVKYTLENYLEYYKYALIRSRILRDIIFALIFVGFGLYILIDNSEQTNANNIAIIAIVMGVLFPMMNFITIPLLKKQLVSRQSEIDRTHIIVTFNDEEIVYENLTVKKEDIKVEEASETEEKIKVEENVQTEETLNVEKTKVVEETIVEENTETKIDEEKIDNDDEKTEENENIFVLHYENFQKIVETKNLFIFYLDRQTVIILPKSTLINNDDFDGFKNLVTSKIDSRRVKFLKTK